LAGLAQKRPSPDLSFADQQRDKKQSRDAAKTLAPAQSVEVGVENLLE
jgi:hypothetical protein